MRSPVALILSIILAVIPAVFYSGLVISLDRFEREPALALLGAFLWGALVAAAFSAIMNTMFGLIVGSLLGKDAAAFLQSGVSAPIMEEASKGAALLLIYFYLRDDFDNILDGIVYGSLIGIGFAMTENISYFGRSFQQGELLALGANFYVRAVLGGLIHASFTGFTGVGLGYARETKSPIRKIIAPVLGFVVAMTLHGLWTSCRPG